MGLGGTVWITRAYPAALSTARRVEALGFQALIDPLLEIQRLEPAVDLQGIAALAFTSANGVSAFSRLTAARDLPVFAVGDATARAAQAVGFAEVVSAEGDVAGLALLIGRARPGTVLAVGAREPAADLPALLAQAGIATRALAVYAAIDRAPADATLARLTDLAAVLLQSPRAARGLAVALERHPAPDLRAFCLSAAVAQPLASLRRVGGIGPVAFAPRPRESALLALLAR